MFIPRINANVIALSRCVRRTFPVERGESSVEISGRPAKTLDPVIDLPRYATRRRLSVNLFLTGNSAAVYRVASGAAHTHTHVNIPRPTLAKIEKGETVGQGVALPSLVPNVTTSV